MFVFIMGCLTEADLTNWVGESGRLLEISDSGPFVENRIEGRTFVQGCVRGDPSSKNCSESSCVRLKLSEPLSSTGI